MNQTCTRLDGHHGMLVLWLARIDVGDTCSVLLCLACHKPQKVLNLQLQGGAAEAVAAQLEGRLRAALKSRANPFAEAAPGLASQLGGRPLLALFDRTFELRFCFALSRFCPSPFVESQCRRAGLPAAAGAL